MSIAGHVLPKHVLDAIEQVALVLFLVPFAWFELFLRQRLGELLERLPLLLVQLLRGRHLDGGKQIAAATAVDVGHPLAAQPQRRPRLRAFGDFHLLRAVERRHVDFAAERDGREIHRNLAEQVHAVAAEELVLLHVNDDVETSWRTAGAPGFAFALQAQLLTSRDAGRNLHGDLAILRHTSGAAARLARVRDRLARAAALRAGACDGEESLLRAHLSLSAAEIADGRRRSGRRARAFARLAVFLARNLDRGFGSGRRLFERDFEVVAQIGAALRTAAAARAAKQVAEAEDVAEAAEDVFEAGEDAGIESAAGRRRHARVAEAIVGGALVGIGEDGVRLGAFLEALFGLVIAGVAIRVVLQRELAIGALDLALACRALDREDLVVVPLACLRSAHALATLTMAGRSSLSPSM